MKKPPQLLPFWFRLLRAGGAGRGGLRLGPVLLGPVLLGALPCVWNALPARCAGPAQPSYVLEGMKQKQQEVTLPVCIPQREGRLQCAPLPDTF